jgi:hypothetical protein
MFISCLLVFLSIDLLDAWNRLWRLALFPIVFFNARWLSKASGDSSEEREESVD